MIIYDDDIKILLDLIRIIRKFKKIFFFFLIKIIKITATTTTTTTKMKTRNKITEYYLYESYGNGNKAFSCS